MKMQIQTPPTLAAEIAALSARMIAAGVRRQQARPGKIYARLVEYGATAWCEDKDVLEKPEHITGGNGNQVEFNDETRQFIYRIAGLYLISQREAANACAWWGLEAFTQYVHALEVSYTPKQKRSVGRPRKYANHEQV